MKAILSKSPGGPETLVLEDVPSKAPEKGDVLIEIKAVGVNYPDVLIIQDQYQFKPERPFSPGGEIAGVVKAVGEGVTKVKTGDRVMGQVGWGGMAEEVTVDQGRVRPFPESMSFEEAAALLMTYGTSYYALKDRGQCKPGESLLVLGAAGGVGLAAVELGAAMGMEVIAAASSQDKVDLAMEKGAKKGFVYPRGPLEKADQKALSDKIKELGGGGVDVIYDGVGGDYAEPALRAMNWDGRFLVIGFPAGIPKMPLNLTLLKSCNIVGVFWGAAVARDPEANEKNIKEIFALYEQGKIKPHISNTYPLEKAPDAISELMNRKAMGKVVVTV
ncbi:NADPH:quinone oxidoreductase family protein [Henriciella aquimarina]|uniref:NADPH:quinone oxidoreductase family protein n=1 Tax=Henriciella aquimarina TaxID=545261 RepID=UPI0009FE213D|nr:NADPH:quinone oxidoreductase family protein [Henriciella aquimarina]